MKTQPISRRSLAAGLALAPVAGPPALAGAPITDDPVLAALAEYERRHAVSTAAWKTAEDAAEALEATRQAIGVVTFKGEEVSSLGRLEYLADRPRPLSDSEWGETIALLKSGRTAPQIEAARPDPEYQAARAALEPLLPAHEAAERAADVEGAEKRAEPLEDKTREAERAVYEAEPTSRAGAIALLRFAADFLEENGVNDTLLEEVFPDAIRVAGDFFEGRA
jgi:hypothetical protein